MCSDYLITLFFIFSLNFCYKLCFFSSRIPRIFNCFNSDTFYFAPHLHWVFDFFARLFTVINSSINFFIYSMTGSEFRKGIGIFLGTGDSSPTYQQTISLHQLNAGKLCREYEYIYIFVKYFHYFSP